MNEDEEIRNFEAEFNEYKSNEKDESSSEISNGKLATIVEKINR